MKRLLFLLGASFLPLASLAQEVEEDSFSPASISFDSSTLQAVTNLARSIVGVNATQDSVDDTASSILALLTRMELSRGSDSYLRTVPYANVYGLGIGSVLNRAFYDATFSNQWQPTVDESLLRMIQRSLYGQKGFPTAQDAIQPILKRFEERSSSDSTILSNLSARVALDSSYLSNLAHRVSQVLVDRFDDFLRRSDENNYRLPESVYSIAQDAEEMRNKFSDLMYLLNSQLDVSLGNLASYLSSIDSRLNGIDSQLQSALNTSLSTLESVLRDVSSYAGDIYTYLGDQEEVLQAISDHTDDTATGVAAIMNWLQYSFDSVLVEALADVTLGVDWSGHPDHFVVTVDNIPSNMMAGAEAYLSNLVDQAEIQGSNVQDIASTVLEWFPIATNFYASATPSREDLAYASFETNSIFTNYVAESDYYESETNDFVAPDFDSVYDQTDEAVPNPWDGGDVVASNVGREAESFFDPGTPEFNTEVVLMGSNDMHLPRIAFSVESVFGASDEARRWGAIMRGLWFFIGFALRFYMVGTWIIWFTQLEK